MFAVLMFRFVPFRRCGFSQSGVLHQVFGVFGSRLLRWIFRCRRVLHEVTLAESSSRDNSVPSLVNSHPEPPKVSFCLGGCAANVAP